MRSTGLFLLAGMLLAACSASDDAVTTSSPAPSTSTTSIPEPTSTTSVTTSTTQPTSTTATETTTTASSPEPGVSVVVAADGVAGWWDGADWREPDDEMPVEEGAEYQVLRIDKGPSVAMGSDPRPGCEFVEGAVTVDLVPDPWEFDPFRPSAIAVAAPWDVTPVLVEELAVTDVYVEVARSLLASQGIDDPDPSYAQLIRTDIDGDGTFEIFAVLELRTGEGSGLNAAPAGDYSMAFARVVLDGEVETAILGEWIVTEQPEGWIQDLQVYRVSALADVDGDGVDEVAVQQTYYEGSATLLWDWQGRDLGFVNVVSVGCGV